MAEACLCRRYDHLSLSHAREAAAQKQARLGAAPIQHAGQKSEGRGRLLIRRQGAGSDARSLRRPLMPSLPGKSGSCWLDKARPTDYPTLDRSIHGETVIIGAGIVGLTAGL